MQRLTGDNHPIIGLAPLQVSVLQQIGGQGQVFHKEVEGRVSHHCAHVRQQLRLALAVLCSFTHIVTGYPIAPGRSFRNVTECICTSCFCCCTLYVTLSMFFCEWMLSSLLCFIFQMSLKDMWECERKWETIPTASHRYHQKRKE